MESSSLGKRLLVIEEGGVNMSVDHTTFNVLSNSFLAIAEEMSADLLRTAHSTVIREAADASTCLIDYKGRILAQASNIPLHLNSITPAIQGSLENISVEDLTEDDVIILNDPYNGGQHQSDIYLFSPIRWDDKIIGFSGSVGHHVDLGHSPGFNLYARDIFEERMRFPPMKFSISKDWNGGILEQVIRANVRLPKQTIGDLNAQLTANFTGRKRFKKLVDEYGFDTIKEASDEFQDYAETQMKSQINSVPPGEYHGHEKIDDDGQTDEPIDIKTNLKVKESEIDVNFEGTDPQVDTAINCPWASTLSSSLAVLKMILTDPMLPTNDGCYRPINVTAEKGKIVNPEPYAPVEGRNVVVMRIFQAIEKALADAIPEKVAAPGYDTRTEVDFHWDGPEGHIAISDLYGGGYGAGPKNDGEDQLDDPLGNCKNTPVEALEATQPLFLVTKYKLRQDSGGPGEHRGGLGAIRVYNILEDKIHTSNYSGRFKHPPEGLFGGLSGTCAHIKVKREDGEEEYLPSKGETILNKGDTLKVAIGGGGGYGSPFDRDREAVARDVADGKVSPKAARVFYGWKEGKEEAIEEKPPCQDCGKTDEIEIYKNPKTGEPVIVCRRCEEADVKDLELIRD